MEPLMLAAYVLFILMLAVLLNLVFKVVSLLRKRTRDMKALSQFSGPKQHWLFGNMREILKHEDVFDYMAMLSRKYLKACTLRQDPFRMQLRVHHPETVQAILNSPEPKEPFLYKFLEPWIGQGLIVSGGHKWARNRRLLTSAFHFDILKPYISIFSKSTNAMVAKWNGQLQGNEQPIELFQHLSQLTMDSLMKCIFGFQGDCQKEDFVHPYTQGVYELTELITERFRCFPYHSDLLYHLTPSGWRFRRLCRDVHSYSQSVIRQKRQQREEHGGSMHADKNYLDFLDMLLDAKDEDGYGLTEAEIQEEVDTFMFAGHDTTTSGISWCLHNLAQHPEHQEKCRQNANEVLGDRMDFTWEDIHKLNFITMCVKESLRLYPAVPMISRRTTKPLSFPDGRTIPEDIWVHINIYGLHHHPEVWTNPEVYDPYRFTPENCKNRTPHAFIPFSAGPRNCIGQHFALHEIKVVVALVLRNFILSPVLGEHVVKLPLIVMKSKGGLRVLVKPIDSQ